MPYNTEVVKGGHANHHRNLSDSGDNGWGIIIFSEGDADQTKNIQRNQVTEHEVIEMGWKAIS